MGVMLKQRMLCWCHETATPRPQVPHLDVQSDDASRTMRNQEETERLQAIAGRVEMRTDSQVCSLCGVGNQVATGGDPDLSHESTQSGRSPHTCERAFLSGLWFAFAEQK